MYKNECNSYKSSNPNVNFQLFCEAVHIAASDGGQCCLEKIMWVFFPPNGFYCEKAAKHSLRNTKDVQ